MKRLIASSILLLMVLLVAGPQDAQAQRRLRLDLAPHIGYGLDVPNQVGDRGTISVGLQAHLGLISFSWGNLVLNPNFDYYLLDIEDVNGWQLDGNLLLILGRRRMVVNPYVGLGLAFTNVTGSEPALSGIQEGSDVGPNLVGGLLFGAGNPRLFVHGRYTLGDYHLYYKESFNPDPSSGLGVQWGILFKLSP